MKANQRIATKESIVNGQTIQANKAFVHTCTLHIHNNNNSNDC